MHPIFLFPHKIGLKIPPKSGHKLPITKGDKFLVKKDRITSSKKEMESLLNKLEYAEGSTIKKGNIKYHKIEEQKRIKK